MTLRRSSGQAPRPSSPRQGSGQADDRRFYDEQRETKPAEFTCPFCRQAASYPIGWLVRRKKAQLEGRASEEDQQRFAKARSYMVRTDDLLMCQNPRCRKRFEIPTLQSVVLL